DPNMPPELKKKWDAEQDRLDVAQKKKDDEDERKNAAILSRAMTLAEAAAQRGAEKAAYGPAIDAAKKAKPMVDVLNASEEYVASGKFTPRQDLALVVRAVRAMNPGTVRLPNKELELEIKAGSYGDRFKRWATGASEGLLPDDQRADLMNVIRTETTQTANSARDDWDQAFGARKVPAPSYLQKFGTHGLRQPTTGPVKMRAPDGTVQPVPADQVEHYKALGAVVVENE